MKKTIEQSIKERIIYIGDQIPESLIEDERPKFILLGTPQEVIDECSDDTAVKLNKDFYNDLPSMICEQLDDVFIPKYGKETWFDEAWEEYRQHIKTTKMDEMKMPMFIFKKFINK